MNRNQKAIALLICLLLAASLTACHTDNDPWPASDGIQTVTSTPTTGQQLPAAETDEEQPSITETQAPTEDEPTQLPGGSEEPGLNG